MAKVSAGSYDLNKWLKGGYDSDVITTLYGTAGTGKTNFCLMAAVGVAKRGGKVIFVDSEGGFSSERVKQLLLNGGKKSDEGVQVGDVLKNIFLLKPTNFKEQQESFDQLLKYLNDNSGVSLIVVDGMTMLYRLEFADARGNGGDISSIQRVNSELTKQMRILAEISRKREIPVVVTNQVYSWENESKMVGGDILKYWSKCLIELVNDKGRRIAFLKKHRYMGEKSISFQIYDGGVRKRGWI